MSSSDINLLVDKSNESLTLSDLEDLLKKVKTNLTLGDIKWPNKLPDQGRSKEFIQKIEQELLKNNKEFSIFPRDHILAQICLDVYRDNLTETGVVSFSDENFIILKTFIEPKYLYIGALYLNESRRQLVLAHRGYSPNWKSLLNKEGTFKPNIESKWLNQVNIPQLAVSHLVTQIACKMAQENKYSLSFTGFSNGAWLAEHSIYFSNKYFDFKKTRAVLFDSPGIVKYKNDLDASDSSNFQFDSMNVVNYLTSPCFINSLNKHSGTVYHLLAKQDKIKVEAFLKEIEKSCRIGKKLRRKLGSKESEFFLNALLLMFTPRSHLENVVNMFEKQNGRLASSDYKHMLDWPLVELDVSANYSENISYLIGIASEQVLTELKRIRANNKASVVDKGNFLNFLQSSLV
jgi:hypothetical protein